RRQHDVRRAAGLVDGRGHLREPAARQQAGGRGRRQQGRLTMRVLVTGSAGMLGWALRDSRPPGVELLEADLPEVDVTRPESVAAAFARARPEAVLHGAAYTNVDGCETHEAEALAVNGAGAGHVAAACARAGIPILHVSTDYVFDGLIPAPGEYS